VCCYYSSTANWLARLAPPSNASRWFSGECQACRQTLFFVATPGATGLGHLARRSGAWFISANQTLIPSVFGDR
jgi:hypothetical protein